MARHPDSVTTSRPVLETVRDAELGGWQEGRWPTDDKMVFGWTLLKRKHRSMSTPELAFRLGEVHERTPICLKQYHSTHLILIDDRTTPSLDTPPRADGILTRRTDLLIGVGVADCVPVFLRFPGGVAALHAGWRGVVAGILPEALEALDGHWDISPDSVEALIGPSIGPCCFEVSGAVSALFPPQLRRARQGKLYVDLPGALMEQWVRHGGRPESFYRADRCTYCGTPKMHSYRRDRTAGRNFAFCYFLDR